jgi:hypothetical protein
MIKFAPIAETEVISLVSEGEGLIAKLRSTAEPQMSLLWRRTGPEWYPDDDLPRHPPE